jgi:hypothetical protein
MVCKRKYKFCYSQKSAHSSQLRFALACQYMYEHSFSVLMIECYGHVLCIKRTVENDLFNVYDTWTVLPISIVYEKGEAPPFNGNDHALLVRWESLTAANILHGISTHTFSVTSRVMNLYSRSKEMVGPLYNAVQKAWRSSCPTNDLCFNFTFLRTLKKHVWNIRIIIAFGCTWIAKIC